MRITVPDDVAETFTQYAEVLNRPAEQLMIEQLVRTAHMRPYDRFVSLNGATLGQLEAILQGGSILSPGDLVTKVQRLAEIRIGGVKVAFSPGALEEIAHMAEKQGLSVEEFTRRTVETMGDQFFHHTARVTADPLPMPPAA